MKKEYAVLESKVPFADSAIWDINRSYYQEEGLAAWSNGVVPHALTSNTFVGKTYAALILGFLKDIAIKQGTADKVYIVELGSGHGRLGYHILKQIDYMISMEKIDLPDYCYVLTDIVESNLTFFQNHPQLQGYLNAGILDVAYYDGVASTEIHLREANKVISKNQLGTPIIAIGNYFFDSLPNDLYAIDHGSMSSCSMTIESFMEDSSSAKDSIKNLKTTIHKDETSKTEKNPYLNTILNEYKESLEESYLLMPRLGIQCIETLRQYSKEGLMLLSIDKGVSKLSDLDDYPEPEFIKHGSFSLYVNFHAINRYCDLNKGKTLFASFADYTLQLGCLLFVQNPDTYTETLRAYDHYVNDFGPDDYNGLKKMIFRLVKELNLRELITAIRMGVYDSNLFLHLLPFIKEQLEKSTPEDRTRLAQTLHKVGHTFFDINEPVNTSYEIAGMFYDMGRHQEALDYFHIITATSGEQADIYYNKILCYYQLRQDELFSSTLLKAKSEFPNYELFADLDKLDLNAE